MPYDINELWMIIIFSSALLGSPGPATISLAASGAVFGFKKTIIYYLGVCTGFCFNVLISALGLGVIFQKYPEVYIVFKYTSLAYIFYIAYKIFTAPPIDKRDTNNSLGFFDGVMLNILNPKAYIAVIAVISQFAYDTARLTSQIFILGVICILTVIFFNICWTSLGSFMNKMFQTPKTSKWINRGLAVALVVSVLLTFKTTGM